MAEPPALDALFARLGRSVGRDLIDAALTHPSAGGPARPDYQRLEFLGDRVLMLVIAEALLNRWPGEAEGKLAPRLNDLVRKETCAAVATELDLGAHLRMERSDSKAGGRKRLTTLGDAMEAVIAAVYLDAGFEVARAVVLRLWRGRIGAVEQDARDAKTALQEWAQARGLPPPEYAELKRSGPDHAPIFTIVARLTTGESAEATAGSKRQAEQAAARALLDQLQAD